MGTVPRHNGNQPQDMARILATNEIALPPTPATTHQKILTDGLATAIELPNNTNTNRTLLNQSNTHT